MPHMETNNKATLKDILKSLLKGSCSKTIVKDKIAYPRIRYFSIIRWDIQTGVLRLY